MPGMKRSRRDRRSGRDRRKSNREPVLAAGAAGATAPTVKPGPPVADSDMDLQRAAWLGNARQKFQELEGRDLRLWSISVLVIVVVAAGLVATVFPNVERGLDRRYVPQLLFGLIALIVLFNLYTFEQRQRVREAREELLRQLLRAEAAESVSLVDPVAGIFSRRYLEPILNKEAGRADRLRSALTLLMVDIGGFKSVNQRYGQLIGDRVLNAVGQILLETFRRADTIIRYGGDEFLVLMPETDEQQAERALERLLVKVERWNRESSLAGYRLGLGCGLATYTKGANLSKLLDAAEQRLHLHKAAPSGAH